jgi:ribosomal protein S18 acetylase RimI-like enzyme
MKIVIRNSTFNDNEKIYNLHIKCFQQSDRWYRPVICDTCKNGYVVEIAETGKVIGVLLYGKITPCINDDIFNYTNIQGWEFMNNNDHLKEHDGIIMLCVDPKYQKKGLATKLINQYHCDSKTDLCLNTRKSNNAYNLYIKLGYNHIGTIKDKYFLPIEDSYFMYRFIQQDSH